MAKNLQYGAGMSAPDDWINYDNSPMIRLQKIPVIGRLIVKKREVRFPKNTLYGDIIKGFPKHNASCDAVYCSHVLEHLTYDEFVTALKNTYSLLKEGGVFRLVMPDLNVICENYLGSSDLKERAVVFMRSSGLGIKYTRKGIVKKIQAVLGNSRHFWLWDYDSAAEMLYKAGFKSVRPCLYNDSAIKAFKSVENPDRFLDSVAIEAIK